MLYLDYNRIKFIYDVDEKLVRVSRRFDDRYKCLLRLSKEQEEYYNKHKEASAYDVWFMVKKAEPPVLSKEELREMEYNRLIPPNKIAAYTTYTIEGNTEKAAAIAAEIIEIKNRVREMYPDEVEETPPDIE